MGRLVHNPSGIDDAYLECLNTCFSGSWCPASYYWYLKRPFGGRSPDIVALYEGDELAAGVGINYRQLNLHGHVVDVAILTAAWTLPKFRGRWHFSRLIRASEPIAREKDCVAILSFVTEHNASAKFLQHYGAHMIPTRYISVATGQQLRLPDKLPEVCETDCTDGWCDEARGSPASFHYVSDGDWRSQFVSRAHPVVALKADNSKIIVERVGDTDRLQYISNNADNPATLAAMARNSQRNSRKLFSFTTSEELAANAARIGMNVKRGYIMIIDLSAKVVGGRYRSLGQREASDWKVQSGDRM